MAGTEPAPRNTFDCDILFVSARKGSQQADGDGDKAAERGSSYRCCCRIGVEPQMPVVRLEFVKGRCRRPTSGMCPLAVEDAGPRAPL